MKYRWHCPQCAARLEIRTPRRYRPWTTVKCFCDFTGYVFDYWTLPRYLPYAFLAIGLGEAIGIVFALRSTLVL